MIKSVTDPASISVRNRAAAGLGELMKHQVSAASLTVNASFSRLLTYL
jgi:hypothetical protein